MDNVFDKNDIDEIIEKYADTVYRVAYARTRSRSDSDDIFQEVFMRYIKNEPQFENENHAKAWFLKVTINCCKKHWASVWFKRVIPLENEVGVNMKEKEDLSNLLNKLPEKYRTVIHLYYYEELKTAQISKILNVKESTIRTWLTRARKILKEDLKGELEYV